LRNECSVPAFVILSDPGYVQKRAACLGLSVPVIAVSSVAEAIQFDQALPVLPTGFYPQATLGHPSSKDAASVTASIEQAVALMKSGDASAIVTNPIAKSVLYEAGFAFPGHTEFLGALAGDQARPVMLLHADELAVVPVTVHLPLKDVPAHLTTELIVSTARIVERDLKNRFHLPSPRIAVAGLNPHAGENGTLGQEENTIIVPALDQLRAEGMKISGPHSADTLFHERARQNYDVVLSMYHDQALIPIKTLAFDRAVNVTLGLPFIRTSPDHGTAFDIAAQGIARPDSLIAALKLAARISRT
jgi:4-hydroxythreonine-4-phosphate dehydrogenase